MCRDRIIVSEVSPVCTCNGLTMNMEIFRKSCLTGEINSIFSVNNIEYFLAFFSFPLFFLKQILDTASNTCRDITITFYVHSVKNNTFDISQLVKITAYI